MPQVSFLTPYWSGREMMRIHLASIRAYFPDAPILISKRGNEREEMEEYRSEFGVRYWIEECTYVDAFLRLIDRCQTKYACVMDHDAVLLSDPSFLLDDLGRGVCDLVGIEERIVGHPSVAAWRWMRLAPGYMDATFLLFNLESFMARFGMRGILPGKPCPDDFEFHYGICERLTRHQYLRPHYTGKYGLGNVVCHEGTPVLWHQWFGAYRTRLEGAEAERYPGTREALLSVREGEQRFLADYPRLDLSDMTPAWAPDCDIHAERRAYYKAVCTDKAIPYSLGSRMLGWARYPPAKLARHALRWMERSWRLR